MALSEKQLSRLDGMFNPRGVAVIGATDSPERVGFLLLESVLSAGFTGEVYPIHPRHKELLGRKVYKGLDDIPDPVDLALIALNQEATVGAVKACGQRGVKGVVCVAGGYKEMGGEGQELESHLASMVREYGLILIGPNTLGLFNADANLNATFYPGPLPPGSGISVVSQSGGVGRAIFEGLRDEGLGVSKWIGVGNRATFDFADSVEYLAHDPATTVILLFVEGTDRGRELVEAAGRVVKRKPIVVMKAGQSGLAQESAITHTGSMIASPKLFSDACTQFGLIEVRSVGELVSVGKALCLCPLPKKDKIGIVTHTAGPSIVLLDELSDRGCQLARFSDATMSKLEAKFTGIPVILKNPLDAAAFGYSPEGYGEVADIVLADESVGLMIAIHALHKRLRFAVPQLIASRKKHQKPVIACYISTQSGGEENRALFHEANIPCYTTIEHAAWGAAGCLRYARLRDGS